MSCTGAGLPCGAGAAWASGLAPWPALPSSTWRLTRFLDEGPSPPGLLLPFPQMWSLEKKDSSCRGWEATPSRRLEGAPHAGRPAGSWFLRPCSGHDPYVPRPLRHPTPRFPFSPPPVRAMPSKPNPGSSSSKKPTGITSPRDSSGFLLPAMHVDSLFPSLLLDVKSSSPSSSPPPSPPRPQGMYTERHPRVLKCATLIHPVLATFSKFAPVNAGAWSSVGRACHRGHSVTVGRAEWTLRLEACQAPGAGLRHTQPAPVPEPHSRQGRSARTVGDGEGVPGPGTSWPGSDPKTHPEGPSLQLGPHLLSLPFLSGSAPAAHPTPSLPHLPATPSSFPQRPSSELVLLGQSKTHDHLTSAGGATQVCHPPQRSKGWDMSEQPQ